MPAQTHPVLVDAFDRDGFALVPSFADASTVTRLSVAIADHPALSASGCIRDALSIPAIRAWASELETLSLASAVLGASAQVVRALVFDKTPNANWPVAWHQDLTIAVAARRDAAGYGPWSEKAGVSHVQPPAAVLERIATVRLHLDPCPAENGALRVLPGTHRNGKLDRGSTAACLDSCDPVVCEADAGDVLLMRPLLLHASSPSRTPAHRRVVHVEYAAGEPGGGLRWATNEQC